MDIEHALIEAAWPYWEAEAEIARRFFAKASADDHLFYLRAQLWKELNPVDGYFNGLHRELAALAESFPEIDRGIDRHAFHFRLSQLAEEKRLGDLRRGYVEGGSAIERAAVGFTEGGGARLFREGAKLAGSPLNDMTARAMRVIYDDERDHYREMAAEAVELIETEEDLVRMVAAIRAISRQRVEMRREMFRGAMTADEIESFLSEAARAFAEGRADPDGGPVSRPG